MTQIGFDLESAHEALDQFLNETNRDGRRIGRWIGSSETGEAVAHIVTDADYRRILNGYHQWTESQEREPDDGLPAGYRPFIHSPNASNDRLLPIEPLLDPICWGMHKKKFAELEDDGDDQWHVRAIAISTALRITLDPDGQGAVPILMVGHEHDEPGETLRWQLAFTTPVAGLYVRASANGFFGDEWGIVTGSGFRIASRWYSKEGATRAAVALGTALPRCDWMRMSPDGFTPKSLAVIKAVVERYQFDEPDDSKHPEPEPLDEPMPADDEFAEATASEATPVD